MANPYYIPQRNNTPGLVLDAMNTIQTARTNRERTGILKKQQELDAEKLGFQRQKFDTETQLKERQLGQADQANRLRTNELPAYDRPFTRLHITDMKGVLGEVGLEDVAKPILNELEEDARQGATTGRVYGKLQAKWPAVQNKLYEGLEKKYMKALEEGDSVRAQDLRETMRLITDDKNGSMILGAVFPQTARAMKMEERALRVDEAGAVGDQYGPRTTDQYGNILQQNITTGEWEKISSPNRSTVIRQTPDGGFEVIQGATGSDMQRGTRKGLEERAVNAQEGIARLQEIAQSYQPEFQQIDTRVKNAWTGLKDKLEGSPLEDWVGKATPEEKGKLEEFSEFKRDALSNINLYIKEITGAQMSEKEAKRIRQALPDPGEGILDGNSPTEFEAKWNRTMRSLKLANARYIYYLKTSPEKLESGEVMSLDRFKNRLEDREEELREAGLGDQEIAAQLNQEFFSLGQ